MHICIEELNTKEVAVVIGEKPSCFSLRGLWERLLFLRKARETVDKEKLAWMIDSAIENLRRAKRNLEDRKAGMKLIYT